MVYGEIHGWKRFGRKEPNVYIDGIAERGKKECGSPNTRVERYDTSETEDKDKM